ncbi:unnamed protein product, partial [Didymodactylos carnosus]
NINSGESETTITLEGLRKIVDYTELFDNVEVCQQYIEQTSDTTTFLVTSGQLGERLIPIAHQLQSGSTIYIHCQNKEFHEQWPTNYSKQCRKKYKREEFDQVALFDYDVDLDSRICAYLAKLARHLYSIPATSAGVERQFSATSLVFNERRSSLNLDTVEDILFGRSIQESLEKDPHLFS